MGVVISWKLDHVKKKWSYLRKFVLKNLYLISRRKCVDLNWMNAIKNSI